MKRYSLFMISMTAVGYCLAAEPTDSVSAQDTDSIAVRHELSEFVVTSERSWVEGNKAVFLPTKKEKNLATDPATLIARMKIPMLVVDGGDIKNLQGNSVPVYINGQPAEGIDISTFWAKRTNRVEYIDHPEDPKYQGAEAVINIIMPEYEIGGITKVDASQTIPGKGRYTAASKLVYKKMTYGATLSYGYNRNHSNSQKGFERYNDIYYNGQLYDNIEHDFYGHTVSRSNDFTASLNARYVTDRTRFTNILSITHHSNPGSSTYNSDSWTPQLFNSHESSSANSSHSLSPSITGQFMHIFSEKATSTTSWNYSYAHNDNSSAYRNGELTPILNGTCEDVHSAALSQMVAYVPKPNVMALFFNLGTSMDWYSTQYSGTSDSHQSQWRGQTSLSVAFRFAVAQKFMFSIDPGVMFDYWHINGFDTHNTVKPTASLSMQWSINRRSSLDAYVRHFNNPPSASQSGDVMIQQDELNWLRAGEDLKNTTTWMSGIYYSWMPVRMFNMNVNFGYYRDDNEFITIYEKAPANMGGVIKTYANGAATDSYTINISSHLRLFDEKVSIFLQPGFSYDKAGGAYARDLFYTRLRGGVSYYLDNFGFNLNYSTPQKGITNAGMMTTWYGQDLNFSASYGNGDVYVQLSFGNLLNRKDKSTSYMNAGIYEQHETSYSTGRCIQLRATYTFGYGKRIDRNIEVDSAGEIKSGSLTL